MNKPETTSRKLSQTIAAFATCLALLPGCFAEPEPDGPPRAETNLEQELEDAIEGLLVEAASYGAAQAAVVSFCEAVDQNPNAASNTIFSVGGKQAFASAVRGAYGNSQYLRDIVLSSDYWDHSGEPLAPETVITQTDNSCMTNIGFVNAVCYDIDGPQYATGSSYVASDAPSNGGCNEMQW